MRHQIEYTFDVEFVRAAIRRDFLWKGYVFAGVFLVLGGVMRFVYGFWDPWITAVCILGAVAIIWRFHSVLRRAATRICELWRTQSPGGTIRLDLDDDGFDVVMDNSKTRYQWAGLRRLWRYDDVWLLEIVRMQSVFFSPDQASATAREYVVERCGSAGVRV